MEGRWSNFYLAIMPVSYTHLTKQITSNYASGANIIVASADQDAKVVEEMGWYDYSYQQLAEAKYGYFAKDGVVGKATFDTVLLPYKNVGKASAEVERIDLGVPTYTCLLYPSRCV